MYFKKFVPFCVFMVIFVFLIKNSCTQDIQSKTTDIQSVETANKNKLVGRMLEEGRTLVHNTVKRFMVILPAIFFKLGIAMTLLVLVTIVSVNNGFIGFMLLVVGLSSVLARLQEARRPAAAPISYVSPGISPYYAHAHILDRSDNAATSTSAKTESVGTYQYYRPAAVASGYTSAYYGQNRS